VRVSSGKMGNKKNCCHKEIDGWEKRREKRNGPSENSGSLSGCGVEIDEVL
jgi:hypothetical protein